MAERVRAARLAEAGRSGKRDRLPPEPPRPHIMRRLACAAFSSFSLCYLSHVRPCAITRWDKEGQSWTTIRFRASSPSSESGVECSVPRGGYRVLPLVRIRSSIRKGRARLLKPS